MLGAVTGGLFTEIVSPLVGYANTYAAYFVILGMAGYFAAIVRAPITGIILISEMTGIFSNLLPLAIVSLAAYITAEIMGGVPIYDQLLERLLTGRKNCGRSCDRRYRTAALFHLYACFAISASWINTIYFHTLSFLINRTGHVCAQLSQNTLYSLR